MKIIRIIARLNVGGPARHVVWLTQGLQDEEFRSLLVAGTVPPGEEDMSYLLGAHGVEPVYIEEMSRELSLKDVVSLFKVYRLMLRERPDVVHTHTAKAGTVGRAAAFLYKWATPGTFIGRPRRVKVVHTFHGHVFHSYYGRLKTSLFILIEKLLARFATDRIIVISPRQLEEIHDQFGVGRSRQLSVVPLGIDVDRFSDADESDAANSLTPEISGLTIGFVGRLTEIKNISLYLKVASEYEKLNAPDLPQLHWVIAGDGHMRAALEAEAVELGIRNITFLGNREDIRAVYAGLDVVALTSLNEGTPLSLIEAMASRKPVIATAVGGVVDLLGSETSEHAGFSVCERGIAVESGNADAFLKGLIYLLKNERLREDLKAKAHEFVKANYGKDRLVADIKRLYRDLV